jgi:hypothetical protein
VFGRWERRQPQPGSATQVNAWNNKVLSAMVARQCYAAGPGIVLSEQPEWAGLSAGRHALGFAVGQEPMPASRAPDASGGFQHRGRAAGPVHRPAALEQVPFAGAYSPAPAFVFSRDLRFAVIPPEAITL